MFPCMVLQKPDFLNVGQNSRCCGSSWHPAHKPHDNGQRRLTVLDLSQFFLLVANLLHLGCVSLQAGHPFCPGPVAYEIPSQQHPYGISLHGNGEIALQVPHDLGHSFASDLLSSQYLLYFWHREL